MTALPDQHDRDVIRGATADALARTVFVDAGAGTGKTTALVDRVVHLVRAGVPVREIAAITFTEAAASELRHRVRAAIEDALAEAHDDEERARLQAALADIDDAAFATLHAFAQRILLDHPLEAALPPELTLLNDIEEAAAFEDRWDAWLADFVAREEIRPVLEHLDTLDVGIPRIRRLARALHDEYHRIPSSLAVEPDGYTAPPLDLTEVIACLGELESLADGAADQDDKLVRSLREWVAAGEPLRRAVEDGAPVADQLDALDRLAAVPLHPGGAARAWGSKDEVSLVRARRRALRDEVIPRVVRAQYDHVLRAMAAWTACFVLQWAHDRRRRGELVFQDLLVLARDLLRDHAEVRARVRARYRHLLIDEFQDTDPIQLEIAVLLGAQDHDRLAAAAGTDGAVPWQDATLEPGRLFFVGDPKQSIYRFRGADIAVYEGAKAFVGGDTGEVRQLTHNFRSVPGVLDWVNATFERLLEPRERAQPAYHALTAQRAPVDGAPRPAVHHLGGVGDGAAEVRDLEARDVLRAVRALVGHVPVTDPATGEVRPARAADVAVLVRRHATARQLERCFDDVGLPLVVEARSLIFSSDEVRDLTTILTAIEDPNDQVAVLGALRHPAFGCSDADLVDWATAGHGWWLPAPDADPADHPVGRALQRLAALRGERQHHSVGGFVERVIAETHLTELALAHPRYRDRWRRIRFVADQAHAFHEAGGHLRGFVRWLRDQAEEGVRRDEHVVPDADDDAVHVTTVHAAKGLEYPIVIVLGLDTMTDRPLHDATLLWGDGDRVEVNVASAAKTAGYEELRDLERTFHREEEQRLLYVATTRARDRLVLSLHHGARNRSGCHAAALLELADDLAPYWSPLELAEDDDADAGAGDLGDLGDLGAGAAADGGGDLEDLDTFTTRHRAAVAAARRPRVLAATTIASHLAEAGAEVADEVAEAVEDEDDAGEDRPQPWRKGRSGSAIGRAVHAVLQTIDLATLDDLDALVRMQVAAEGLPPEDAGKVAAMVRRAAGAPIVAEALTSGRYWRELHVGAPVDRDGADPVTVEGFVDLLVETDDGLVVVDHKTDTVHDGDVDRLLARYAPQAATYALALETALGRPVDRCVFVLASASAGAIPQVEIGGDDLRAAVGALRDALARGELTPA